MTGRPVHVLRIVGWLAAAGFCLTEAGCGRADSPAPAPANSVSSPAEKSAPPAESSEVSAEDPDTILQRMVKAYQDAPSYSDRGRVMLEYRQRGDIIQDEAPLSVASVYPARLRVAAYRALAVCDGDKLYARIEDELSGNLDGQVLARKIEGGELTLDQLYADPVLRDAMTSGLGRRPIQLDLLLSDDPLSELLTDQVSRRLLADEQFQGRTCHRVETTTEEGAFVFWIGRDDSLLLRLDYPVESILPELAADENVRDLRLSAEFREARFKPAADDTQFVMKLPADSRQVAAFVLPPPPLPSKLFGKRPLEFEFQTLTGDTVSQADLDGSLAILLWFNRHPACRTTLEQLSAAAAEWEDEPPLIYAVSTEPSDVSARQIEDLLREWEIELPVLRDLKAAGRDVFEIPWAPTLVVLDEQGAVQIFQVGANPDLSRELPVIVQRLREGNDLAGEILAEQERQQAEDERLLELAQNSEDPQVIELAMANIEPRSEPQKIKLRRLWSLDDLRAPGNICVYRPADQATVLLIVEAGTTVAQVAMDGQVVSRHELELANDRVAAVRVAKLAGQPHYLASAIQGRFVHRFDSQWQPLLRYPAADQRHPGISDFQLADLENDGVLETLVAFAGEVGVHSVAPDGQRVWSNRAMPNVLSLALTAGDDTEQQELLVTGETGAILPLDAEGRQGVPIEVPGLEIFHLFAGAPSDADTPYCGVTYSPGGNLIALGLDREFREVWSYPLPAGIFRNPIEFVVAGSFDEQPYWCLAAPNGSIHWIRSDGQAADFFSYGAELTGLALVDDVLIVATRQELSAWRMQAP